VAAGRYPRAPPPPSGDSLVQARTAGAHLRGNAGLFGRTRRAWGAAVQWKRPDTASPATTGPTWEPLVTNRRVGALRRPRTSRPPGKQVVGGLTARQLQRAWLVGSRDEIAHEFGRAPSAGSQGNERVGVRNLYQPCLVGVFQPGVVPCSSGMTRSWLAQTMRAGPVEVPEGIFAASEHEVLVPFAARAPGRGRCRDGSGAAAGPVFSQRAVAASLASSSHPNAIGVRRSKAQAQLLHEQAEQGGWQACRPAPASCRSGPAGKFVERVAGGQGRSWLTRAVSPQAISWTSAPPVVVGRPGVTSCRSRAAEQFR